MKPHTVHEDPPFQDFIRSRCGHHSCFFIVTKFYGNTASFAPSVNVGRGEGIFVGTSEFSVIVMFSATWIVLDQ